MDAAIIPECCVDTNLVETLAPPAGRGYNHQHGCTTVAKVMRERFADGFALGIIDKDKRTVDYLADFRIIAPDPVEMATSLILYKHESRPHYIIQINPAMEQFILSCAAAAGISVADYGLPTDFDLFKKECKQTQSKADQRFKRLFTALLQADSPDMVRMAGWVKHLQANPYKVDITLLNGF